MIAKFRAFHKEAEQMYEVLNLDFTVGGCTLCNGSVMTCIDEYLSNVELMQFTGLLDKNGKEIYEGDIVKHEYWNAVYAEYRSKNYEVYFDDESLKFDTRYNMDIFEAQFRNEYEIIGNIWQNSNLLEVNHDN